MRRREFFGVLGGAAAAWPVVARAQQLAPVVGFLRHASSAGSADLLVALRHGLEDTGFIEGKNLTVEYRWSETVFDRLPTLAAELVNHRCSVIVGAGNAAALALKAATATIPIVFATGDDPIQAGIVPSLNRPGGNITGVWFFSGAGLQSKQLELLRDAVPGVKTIGILVNRNSPAADSQAKEAQIAARAFGQEIHIAYATSEKDLDGAFATLIQQHSGGISLPAMRCSQASANCSSGLRRTTPCRQYSLPGNSSPRVACLAMGPVSRKRTAKWAVILASFSKARILENCQYCGRPNSS